MNLQQIPLIATSIQASPPFWVADELKFRLLQLEGIAEGFRFQLARVEQKLMGGDGEKRFRQLPDAGLEEVLDILAGQYQQRIFLPVALHQVADVFYGRQVGEK